MFEPVSNNVVRMLTHGWEFAVCFTQGNCCVEIGFCCWWASISKDLDLAEKV